jgi:hypothetical protein
MGFTRGGGQFAHLDGFECKYLQAIIKIWAYFLKISKIIIALCRKVEKIQIQKATQIKPWAM